MRGSGSCESFGLGGIAVDGDGLEHGLADHRARAGLRARHHRDMGKRVGADAEHTVLADVAVAADLGVREEGSEVSDRAVVPDGRPGAHEHEVSQFAVAGQDGLRRKQATAPDLGVAADGARRMDVCLPRQTREALHDLALDGRIGDRQEAHDGREIDPAQIAPHRTPVVVRAVPPLGRHRPDHFVVPHGRRNSRRRFRHAAVLEVRDQLLSQPAAAEDDRVLSEHAPRPFRR